MITKQSGDSEFVLDIHNQKLLSSIKTLYFASYLFKVIFFLL